MHAFSKVLIFLFVVFTVERATAQDSSVFIEHYIADTSYQLGNYSVAYSSVENAIVRSLPGVQGEKLLTLPIGSALKLLFKSNHTFQSGGVESHWYKIQHGKIVGWIWGGLITAKTEGSQRNSKMKFLLSYAAMDSIKMGEIYVPVRVADLRAVKDGVQCDRKRIKIQEPLMNDLVNVGTKGLTGIDDLLRFSISGESCGHFSGEVYVGWDGKKFTDEWIIGGVADAEFYEGEFPVFPTAMEGLKDTILVRGAKYETWFEWQDVSDEQGNEITEVVAWFETKRKVLFKDGQWRNIVPSYEEVISAYTIYTALGSKMYLPEQLPADVQRQLVIDRKNRK